MSYIFLIIGVISLLCFLYFKFIAISSSKGDERSKAILGNMKNPELWRNVNNKMSYVSLFWTIISLGGFIYLKFFMNSTLLSIFIPFIYLALIIISSLIFSRKNEKSV
nr:hypothetical protein [Clostridium simiarum]